MPRSVDENADVAAAKLARQQLIEDMQRKAAAARSRWRDVMFSRASVRNDAVALDRYEAEEAEARAAMIRADRALFCLTRRCRPDWN